MATTELTHVEPTSVGEHIRRVVAVSASRVAAVWQAAKNRRSVGRLLELDDRMLRDIGLTQGDVRSALATPVDEDPSARLRFLSSERRSALRAQAREKAAHRLDGIET